MVLRIKQVTNNFIILEKFMHKMQYLLRILLKLKVKMKYYFQVVLHLK